MTPRRLRDDDGSRLRAGSLVRAAAAVLVLVIGPLAQASCQEALPGQARRSSAGASTLRVSAVQLSVSAEMLQSLEAYRASVTARVEESLSCRPELIVFPEYTGAFLALVPHGRPLAGARTVPEGLEAIRQAEPLVDDLHELFLLNSGWVERAYDELFGGLARRHRVTILAGSYFAWAPGEKGPRLVNRAVVFGVDGRRLYEQDKVYLTPFEEAPLGLSPGSLSDARPFRVDGARVGVTICRDTFFSAWERRLGDSDLWIDIKANGTKYTEQERLRFQRALPARIRSAGVPYGLTVCLTGELLDLVWEGESSLVQEVQGAEGSAPRIVTLRRSASPQGQEVLPLEVSLPPPGR